MPQPRYITPLEQSVLAWPSSIRPGELGPARIGLVTPTATGGGSLLVSGVAFDTHAVRVEIVTGGEPGQATYRYWTDGATLGDLRLTATAEQELLHTAVDEITGGADTGLRVAFAAGTVPSFNAGDRWEWTTSPVQKIVAAIIAASTEALELLGARYQWLDSPESTAIKRDVAKIVRLDLAEDRGLNPSSADGKLYIDSAARARARLLEVATKKRHPKGLDEGPIYSPDVYEGADRYGISAAHRQRGGAR